MVSSPSIMTFDQPVNFLPRPAGGVNPLWSIRGKYGAVGVGGVVNGCLAHYQPKADALGQIVPTILTQYRNWANPGTYDATLGTAPAWAVGTGWTFNGATQYLMTGILPVKQIWSMIIRFSNDTSTGVICGAGTTTAQIPWFLFRPRYLTTSVAYGSGSSLVVVPTLVAGTLGIGGTVGYRNGVPDGNIPTFAGVINNTIAIGALNWGVISLFEQCTITTLDIYNLTLDAADNANLHSDYGTFGL